MSALPTSAASSSEPTKREIREVFVGLMIVLALAAIDQSIVATALPRIVTELGGLSDLSWVVTAYVLTSTATMPLYGKLSDQYGRKPILYASILIFLIGSALSGAAHSLLQLIVFRAVQGVGAGGLMPLAQIIIGDLVPPAERGRRQGAIVAVFAVCSVLGPLLGGLITDLLSWRWIFYVNLPVGAVSMIVIARALRRANVTHRRRIDYLGAAVLMAATTALLLVLALGGTAWPWNSPQIAASGGAAIALGALFVWHVRRVPEPVLPLELFGDRLFLVASLVLALTFMGIGGASLFFPLFFQLVMGVSAANSGVLTGPLMVGIVISSIFNGRVLLRSGRYKRTQLAGLTIAVLAFAALAWGVTTAQKLTVIEPAIFALGLGLGFVAPNMTIAVQNGLPAVHRGVGTATLAFFRSLGALVGVAGAGAVLAMQLPAAGADAATPTSADPALIELYRHAIALIFTSGVCVVALALVALFFLPELPLRAAHPPHEPVRRREEQQA
ncbi:MAG TPA: MDR family MFS transporter [Roseiarcus sp.]|jgi:EmrB/QacA subfamily drug resistance transporter